MDSRKRTTCAGYFHDYFPSHVLIHAVSAKVDWACILDVIVPPWLGVMPQKVPVLSYASHLRTRSRPLTTEPVEMVRSCSLIFVSVFIS